MPYLQCSSIHATGPRRYLQLTPTPISHRAAYGDWQTLCPTQTFTQEGLLANFPNSTEQPWTVLDVSLARDILCLWLGS